MYKIKIITKGGLIPKKDPIIIPEKFFGLFSNDISKLLTYEDLCSYKKNSNLLITYGILAIAFVHSKLKVHSGTILLHSLRVMNLKIFLCGLLFVIITITEFTTNTMMRQAKIENQSFPGLYLLFKLANIKGGVTAALSFFPEVE